MSSDERCADSPRLELSSRLGYLLKHVQVGLAASYAAALAPHGIDAKEWVVLLSLAADHPTSQQQIAHRLGIDRTTIVALLDTLQRKGLVSRHLDPEDRRRNIIELTAAGLDTLNRATRAGEDAERHFLSPLSQHQAQLLIDLLRTLIGPGR